MGIVEGHCYRALFAKGGPGDQEKMMIPRHVRDLHQHGLLKYGCWSVLMLFRRGSWRGSAILSDELYHHEKIGSRHTSKVK